MRMLRQDFEYAVRIFFRRPGFTIVAALTLAIGIGANVSIFSLINGVLLRPLPFPDSGRLLNLSATYAASEGQPDIFSPGLYLDLADASRTLESLAGYTQANFALSGDGQPEQIAGLRTTASMSRVLGIVPQLGRWFTPEEDAARESVAVLSDSLWRRRFGADPAIIGKSIDLNAKPVRVLGVLPPNISFPSPLSQIYAPIGFGSGARANRGAIFLTVIARRRAEAKIETVNAELQSLSAGLSLSLAANSPDAVRSMAAVSLQESLVGNVREMLIALWAAVAFMLAVGCANVANLLLSHAAGRRKEFALRRSLGASDGRLIRQLLTESMTLAVIGGALGLALAALALPAVAAWLPASFPRLHRLELDAQALWFTAGISLFTGMLFGLAPAIGSARQHLSDALKDGLREQHTPGNRVFGRALVVAEVTAVMILLIGAGLVLRSLHVLSQTDPGFRSQGVIAWQMFLPPARYAKVEAERAFYRAVLDQVAAAPGTQSAAFAQPLPFGPVDIINDGGFHVAGEPEPASGQVPQALVTRVTPGYFSTMGIAVEKGRVFTDQDPATAKIVVISHALATRYFGTKNPIGRQLLLGDGRIPAEIVGVAADVKHINLKAAVRPEVYIPFWNFTPGAAGLVVKSAAGPTALTSIRERVWSVDSSIPANLAAPLEEILYASMAPARIAAILMGAFAATTLFLGLVGVYGVLSYAVRQRRTEIGIRMALGASRSDVLGMVMSEALRLSAAGVAFGSLAAFLLSRFLETLLFGVKAGDPATYVIVALTVPVTAALAAYLPARRAAAIDPAISLRSS